MSKFFLSSLFILSVGIINVTYSAIVVNNYKDTVILRLFPKKGQYWFGLQLNAGEKEDHSFQSGPYSAVVSHVTEADKYTVQITPQEKSIIKSTDIEIPNEETVITVTPEGKIEISKSSH
jgi:hypothetical protein